MEQKLKKFKNVPEAEAAEAEKVGILGGAFNPVHIGHLICAQEAADRYGLDEVVFMPTGTPPHKEIEAGAGAADRLRMTEIATAGNPRFSVSRHEIDSGRVSYTVDTLRHFRDSRPEAELYFITGSDAVIELLEWKDPTEVASLAVLIVAIRPGYPLKSAPAGVRGFLEEHGAQVLPVPGIDISSTQLRERIASGRPVRYLVSEGVEVFIEEKRLYLP